MLYRIPSLRSGTSCSRFFSFLILIVSFILFSSPIYAADLSFTWVAPTTNADGTPPLHTDGSPLTDLNGFYVKWGTSPGVHTAISQLIPANTLVHTVTGLNSNTTYYFAVTAVDTSGNESNYVNELQVTTSGPIDSDGDGVDDSIDNCPNVSNPSQADNDGDGQGDACDPDDDNDGVNDSSDNCQFIANSGQQNNDGDSQGDACDSDDDNDGVNDGLDNCQFIANPSQSNNDGDAFGDACDSDDDNDGVNDSSDNCQFIPNPGQQDTDGDGIGDACDTANDNDGDGVPNSSDNCPNTPNPQQENFDGDSQGDACDSDDDNDTIADGSDCAPLDATRWRLALAYPDIDSDGIRNSTFAFNLCYGTSLPTGFTTNAQGLDNCPNTPNADQTNTDGDSQGDACDSDDDNDGVNDTSDCAPLDSSMWQDQAYLDSDSDGIADDNLLVTSACFGSTAPAGYTLTANGPDNCPNMSNADQADSDSDGIGDLCDSDLDSDGDGVANDSDCSPMDSSTFQDQAYPDADEDGVRDDTNLQTVACFGTTSPAGSTLAENGPDNCPDIANADQADNDGDGIGDACDSDDRDRDEDQPTAALLDFDGDGTSDLVLEDRLKEGLVHNILGSNVGAAIEASFGSKKAFIAHADYDGDGKVDVAVVEKTADGLVWNIQNSSNGETSTELFGKRSSLVLSGCDFDLDKIADKTVLTKGKLDINSSSSELTTLTLPIVPRKSALYCADFNGDGIDEIFFSGKLKKKALAKILEESGEDKINPYIIGVYALDGSILFEKSMKKGSNIFAADINADGKEELGYYTPKRKRIKFIEEGARKPARFKVSNIYDLTQAVISTAETSKFGLFIMDKVGGIRMLDFETGQEISVADESNAFEIGKHVNYGRGQKSVSRSRRRIRK